MSKVVIVLHQETSIPGRVGRLLRNKGYELDIRRPVLGEALPEDLENYAGSVIFGGPMSANDDDAFIRREIDWIGRSLVTGTPFLGICLGGQMLAKYLGGRVFGYPDERAEIGYYPIEPTRAGRDFGPWPQEVYQWHREGFDLVKGAVRLAIGGDHFPEQAFQYGQSAFGIQFHPEVTQKMMHRWLAKAEHRLALPGAQPRQAHFEGRFMHDHQVERWLDEFLDSWLATHRDAREAIAAE